MKDNSSLFQISDETNENDLDFAFGVLRWNTYWRGILKIEVIPSVHNVE